MVVDQFQGAAGGKASEATEAGLGAATGGAGRLDLTVESKGEAAPQAIPQG